EKQLAVIEPDEINGDGAGIDADASHRARKGNAGDREFCVPILLAISYSSGELQNRLGIEHLIVALEETRDAGLVDLHLEPADADGAEGRDAILLLAVIGDVDASDAQRGDGVDIALHEQAGAIGPRSARHEHDAGGAGVEQDLGAVENLGGLVAPAHAGSGDLAAETLADGGTHALPFFGLARRDRHIGPRAGEETGGARSDGSRAGRDHRALALHVAHGAHDFHYSRYGGRVRAVGVEHERHLERAEQGLLRGLEQLLSRSHVTPANEDGGVLQIPGTASEEAAMNEIANITLGNATATHDCVR